VVAAVVRGFKKKKKEREDRLVAFKHKYGWDGGGMEDLLFLLSACSHTAFANVCSPLSEAECALTPARMGDHRKHKIVTQKHSKKKGKSPER
jgi:hypothetical protein